MDIGTTASWYGMTISGWLEGTALGDAIDIIWSVSQKIGIDQPSISHLRLMLGNSITE